MSKDSKRDKIIADLKKELGGRKQESKAKKSKPKTTGYVVADLKKTAVLSLVAIGAELGLFYLLEVSGFKF